MFNDICLRRKVINVHNTFGYYLLFCVTFSTLHFSIMKLGVGIKFSLFSLLTIYYLQSIYISVGIIYDSKRVFESVKNLETVTCILQMPQFLISIF